MAYAFNGTTPNLNYAVNRLNRNTNVIQGIINGIGGTIGGITGGNGQQATNDKVEAAVQWAINKATNNYITYSQANRNLKNVNGMSYDCSSFVITAFYAAGVDIDATYTGDMISGFTAAGWKWIPGPQWEASQLLRGDILLNIVNHTQMYIGNNQDVNCGSTPARVLPHAVRYYYGNWDGILRYQG